MQLINVKCIILVDLIISRNISIPLNQDWCVFSSSGFQLGWNISIGWCFATREKVAVTPERISNAFQQVKCEAPLKHPVASLCPLQCCCGAAVASRALAGWAGPRMSLFVGPSHKQRRGTVNLPIRLWWTSMSQTPSPAATLLHSNSR